MSARRMPCKRCHHPKPVGPDGYCAGCAGILARMKQPKSVPPEPSEEPLDGANKMDVPDGPKCACGKPSAFEDGSCVDCAVDGAKGVEDWADKLAGDLVEAGEVERDTLSAGAHEGDPITERSSKVPTLPPVTSAESGMAGGNEGGFSTSGFTHAIDGVLQEPIAVAPDPGVEVGNEAVTWNKNIDWTTGDPTLTPSGSTGTTHLTLRLAQDGLGNTHSTGPTGSDEESDVERAKTTPIKGDKVGSGT